MSFSFNGLIPSDDPEIVTAFATLLGEDFATDTDFEWDRGRGGTFLATLAKAVDRDLTPAEEAIALILGEMRRKSRESDALANATIAFVDRFGYELQDDDSSSSPRAELEDAIEECDDLKKDYSIKRYLEYIAPDDDDEDEEE